MRPADWGEQGAPGPGGDICLLLLRVLSFNNLTRLDEESLADLSSLSILRLSHNAISHVAEGAFKGLKSLRVLYVSHCGVDRVGESPAGRAEQSKQMLC